jgi:hypothetical protein
MIAGLLHLHSFLRWVILLLLLVSLYYSFVKSERIKSTGLWLMITSHVMLVIGLYQWFRDVFNYPDFKSVVATPALRFFKMEHPVMMVIAVILITLARRKAKELNYRSHSIMLGVALLIILAMIPWPFREAAIARPWFPGM